MMLSFPSEDILTMFSSLFLIPIKDSGAIPCVTTICFGKRRHLAKKSEMTTGNTCVSLGFIMPGAI